MSKVTLFSRILFTLGIAFVVIFTVGLAGLNRIDRESMEWLAYGLIVPGTLLAYRISESLPLWLFVTAITFVIAFVLKWSIGLPSLDGWVTLLACLGATFLIFRIVGKPEGWGEILFLLTAWIAAQKIHFWGHGFFNSLYGSHILVFIGAVFVTGSILGKTGVAAHSKKRPYLWLDVLFILFFWEWSMRSNAVADAAMIYNWPFYVGPIQMVRQGGALLWNVPSQYGFLSTLLPALLPVQNAFASFGMCVAFLNTLMATVLYLTLSRLGSGLRTRILSGVLAFSIALLTPGWLPDLAGPSSYPSTGGYRFFWATFLALLCSQYIHNKKRWVLLALGICYVIGCLWASESAFYCTAVAFSFFISELYRESRSKTGPRFSSTVKLAFPFSLLLFVIGSLSLFYANHLEWRSLSEFSVAYAQGFGALPVDLTGGVLTLVLVYGALTSAETWPWVALVVATASYFVSRSHENNLVNLTPIWILSLGAGIVSAEKARAVKLSRMLRLILIPLCTILLALTFGNVRKLYEQLVLRWKLDPSHSVAEVFGKAQMSRWEKALQEMNIGSAPITDLTDSLVGLRMVTDTPRTWLPILPASEFVILPLSRQETYLERWANDPRNQMSYLLSRHGETSVDRKLIDRVLGRTGWFRKKVSELSEGYLIEQFERIDSPIPVRYN